MNIFIYIICFIIYFGLHYIEGLPPIGGLSTAQLWKIPLIGFLLVYALSSKRKLNQFEKTGYLYSFEPFLCPAILTNPFAIVTFSMRQMPIPLFFNFWHRYSSKTLEKLLLVFAQFICLTSLVTLLGIVDPIKDYMSAEGFIEDLQYYSSIYPTIHASSSYFCISSIIIIFFFIHKKFKTRLEKIFNLILLLVALYSLFLSYVRTGWLMLLMGLLFIVDFKHLKAKNKIRFLFALVLVMIGLIYFYNTNDAFRTRISGSGQYRGESEHMIDTEGSGRSDFWKSGITNWAKNDPYSMLFGKGLDAVKEDNYRATGMRVFSHSLFVDSLAQYGIISLLLLIMLYRYIYLFIKRYGRGSPYQDLSKSIFFGAIIFCTFQSQIQFDYIILFTISLVLMYKTNSAKSKRI